ncbi:MAG: NUDIX hydrolase [Methanobrevibacter sp.]|nr:NUDIX hydrolase [Methanobrevibacter sp.]
MKSDYGLTMRGIIKNSDGEILIVKRHPKSRTDPDTWELPGGKVDEGESFDDALVREIKEETNLDCKVGDLAIAIQHNYPHKRTVQMIMHLDDVEGELMISDEHTDAKYASIDEIKTLTLSSCLEKVLEKKNYVL